MALIAEFITFAPLFQGFRCLEEKDENFDLLSDEFHELKIAIMDVVFGTVFEKREKLFENLAYLNNEQQ